MRSIRRAPLCRVCRTFGWHPNQWPIHGHHPACPTLSKAHPLAADTGASMEATKDYIGFTDGRFISAARALKGEEPWMAPSEKPYDPANYGSWAQRDPFVIPEFERQNKDWRAWYAQFGQTPFGWTFGYDEVQAFDTNLSRVLERAKAAGADISSVPKGRHTDPAYKQEQEDEQNPLQSAATILKWGVIGYLVIQVAGVFKK
jgi:hypothetical protein